MIVSMRDNKDYIRILVYSYYTTITGWGGPPNNLDVLQTVRGSSGWSLPSLGGLE